MLVLSRKANRSIAMRNVYFKGDDGKFYEAEIVVMVVEIRGDKARLGIEAPKQVSINRDEIWAVIDSQNGS